MNKRKVCVVTGNHNDYSLLYNLIKEINQDNTLELQLVVTGKHLSPDFGSTYKEIEKDFKIDRKIEMLSKLNTPVSISNSMGLAHIGFGTAYDALKPDLVVVLGDKYEILAAVTSAMIARIPIAHLCGGKTGDEVMDETIRHAITKMSHLHFTDTIEDKNRVIQLGECPENIFVVEGICLENSENSYENIEASKKMIDIIKHVDFSKIIL